MKEMPKISQKHLAFLEEYFKNGNKAVDAYMEVYKGASYNTARVNSFKVLQRPEVKEYIEWRTEELQKETIMTINDRKKVLAEIIKKGSNSEKINAIKEMNNMENIYKSNINVTTNDTKVLDELSVDELKKLIYGSDDDGGDNK